ncbi:MAG: hypothetical protein NZ610_05900 [Candidatus Bipolaricaulota bacterium]|nr:hypothetical protein [Candidatus Bipolaricaulota bacterium]MCS7274914.1 hypothetical protein [Candidatus Bipolaricaulota bacterium]MDW8110281.1 hypothetical protein [Candidatus Bipolaricaulota bacterium]MDW8328818.1 hypothetical protein [Candidatus Bipolaricaulota bacterium]
MSELIFAVVILIAALVGLVGLGSMVISPPLAQKIFLVAGVIGMLGFFGYAVVRVRAERREQSQKR